MRTTDDSRENACLAAGSCSRRGVAGAEVRGPTWFVRSSRRLTTTRAWRPADIIPSSPRSQFPRGTSSWSSSRGERLHETAKRRLGRCAGRRRSWTGSPSGPSGPRRAERRRRWGASPPEGGGLRRQRSPSLQPFASLATWTQPASGTRDCPNGPGSERLLARARRVVPWRLSFPPLRNLRAPRSSPQGVDCAQPLWTRLLRRVEASHARLPPNALSRPRSSRFSKRALQQPVSQQNSSQMRSP